MRIVHISDWHSLLRPALEADLYLVTGDMCPNQPTIYRRDERRFSEPRIYRGHEEKFQTSWAKEKGQMSRWLESKNSPRRLCQRQPRLHRSLSDVL